jgi:hypothetical protein
VHDASSSRGTPSSPGGCYLAGILLMPAMLLVFPSDYIAANNLTETRGAGLASLGYDTALMCKGFCSKEQPMNQSINQLLLHPIYYVVKLDCCHEVDSL